MLRSIVAAAICLLLSTCSLASKLVLGKLGQVTEATKIYSRPSTHARVYYQLKPYEYLVIKPKTDQWLMVLLSNGMYGYVQSDTVAKLPYVVTANQQPRSSGRASVMGSRGNAIAARYALDYVGTPYVWGGNSPTKGIDCSGLVQQMFGRIGVDLPRTAAEQVHVGTAITRLEDLRAGDRLYFWDSKRGKIGHTGIYMGGGYFVHSSRTHNGVATDYLGERRWLNILVAARRS